MFEASDQNRGQIFIIGAARSGTKFLRDCLGADPRIFTVPYDVNYIWRYKQQDTSSDVLLPESLNQEIRDFIEINLNKQARKPSSGILLEKTVSNSLRVPFVESVFPHARYVHLIRDGRDVTESAMREWTSPPDYRRLLTKALRLPFASIPYIVWFATHSILGNQTPKKSRRRIWGPRYPGIEDDIASKTLTEICAIQWKKSVEFAMSDLDKIPSDRVFSVRYEDIVRGPDTITKLAKDLALDVDFVTKTWENTVQRKSPRKLTDLERAKRKEIETLIATTLTAAGYDMENPS